MSEDRVTYKLVMAYELVWPEGPEGPAYYREWREDEDGTDTRPAPD